MVPISMAKMSFSGVTASGLPSVMIYRPRKLKEWMFGLPAMWAATFVSSNHARLALNTLDERGVVAFAVSDCGSSQ